MVFLRSTGRNVVKLKLGDFAPIICGKFGLKLSTMYSCPLITLQRAEFEHRPEVASSPGPSRRGGGAGDEAKAKGSNGHLLHSSLSNGNWSSEVLSTQALPIKEGY